MLWVHIRSIEKPNGKIQALALALPAKIRAGAIPWPRPGPWYRRDALRASCRVKDAAKGTPEGRP